MGRFRTLEDGSREWFAGGGFVLRSISMRPVAEAAVPLGFVRNATHAEGLALLHGVTRARALGASQIRARVDSMPLLRILEGLVPVREPWERDLVGQLTSETAPLASFRALWTPSFHGRSRGDGMRSADILAREAAGLEPRRHRNRRRWTK
jgi:ribonuclease HI